MAWRQHALSVYRLFLFAYPAEFRHEYSEEMERLFAMRLDTEPQVRLWLDVLADAAVAAPREHFHILTGDLRHGIRLFLKTPGFLFVALLAIALGVASTTTVFSLINAVLIRTLPYGNAERLVYLWTPFPPIKELPREVAPPFADVLAWRGMSQSFSDITAVQQRMLVLNDEGPIRIGGARVLGNFFQTLNAVAQLGRPIDVGDDHPGQPGVAVISDALWRSRFGGNPDVLGRVIQIDRQSYRVIGVMPKEFAYPHANDFPGAFAPLVRTDIWIPAALSPQQQSDRTGSGADVAIGRLRPGVSLQQAQSEMSVIEKQLEPLYPVELRGIQALLIPFIETTVGAVRPALRLLMGAVFLVLLIACSDVASLLMARAVGRVHELGVRTALGADRARLIRQMLTESLMLAAAGGALGALLSFVVLKAVTNLNPGDIPRFEEASLDARVLLFAVLISLGTGLVFGIIPALSGSSVDVSELLRQGRGVAGVPSRANNALVVSEVALSVVLLTGAGLLIRSYRNVQNEEKGFAPSTLTMQLTIGAEQLTANNYPQSRNPQSVAALFQRLLAAIRTIPGVEAAGAIDDLPLSHAEDVAFLEVEGYANHPNQTVNQRQTGGEYFQAMQIRLISGRFLNDRDIPAQSQPAVQAVVVSESFATLYFPDKDVVGRRLRLGGGPPFPWSTIVGVVADVRHTSLEKVPQPTVYVPSWNADTMAVRVTGPPGAVISSIRRALRRVDPRIALADIQTMDQRISEAVSRRRFQTVVLAAFAGIAVFLALVGLYGLLSYSVRRRTAEIGVHVALGASRWAVLWMVVRHGLTLTAAGLAIGLPLACAVTRGMAGFLYGVSVNDPITFLALPVSLLAVAVIASLVPALKAARIDPISALRYQ